MKGNVLFKLDYTADSKMWPLSSAFFKSLVHYVFATEITLKNTNIKHMMFFQLD